jgi:hypothetical protein
MIFFTLFKKKVDKEFRMFSNIIFDNEKTAEEFADKSMKRGFEFKVVEYNNENYRKYWYK